jgi:hypothetical protein
MIVYFLFFFFPGTIGAWQITGACGLYLFMFVITYESYLYSDWLRAGLPRGRSSSPSRVKHIHFSISSTPALGSTQLPIQWVLGALSPGVKWQAREADHSPPISAEVKKTWLYRSTST